MNGTKAVANFVGDKVPLGLGCTRHAGSRDNLVAVLLVCLRPAQSAKPCYADFRVLKWVSTACVT